MRRSSKLRPMAEQGNTALAQFGRLSPQYAARRQLDFRHADVIMCKSLLQPLCISGIGIQMAKQWIRRARTGCGVVSLLLWFSQTNLDNFQSTHLLKVFLWSLIQIATAPVLNIRCALAYVSQTTSSQEAEGLVSWRNGKLDEYKAVCIAVSIKD